MGTNTSYHLAVATDLAPTAWLFCQVSALVPGGGGDEAEDMAGALAHVCQGCDSGPGELNWQARIRFCVVISDAPAHGYAPEGVSDDADAAQATASMEAVAETLQSSRINVMLCTLNEEATAKTDEGLRAAYNASGELKMAKAVPLFHTTGLERPSIHFVFVLDESASMNVSLGSSTKMTRWAALRVAYQTCLERRREVTQSSTDDLVTVIQFSTHSHCAADCVPITKAPDIEMKECDLTNYAGAFTAADAAIDKTPSGHQCCMLFMTDGEPRPTHKHGKAELAAIRSKYSASKQLQVGGVSLTHAFGLAARLPQLTVWNAAMQVHVICLGHEKVDVLTELAAPGTAKQAEDASQLISEFASVGETAGMGRVSEEFASRLSQELDSKIVNEFL